MEQLKTELQTEIDKFNDSFIINNIVNNENEFLLNYSCSNKNFVTLHRAKQKIRWYIKYIFGDDTKIKFIKYIDNN